MQRFVYRIAPMLAIGLLVACGTRSSSPNDPILAKVYDEYLYGSEIADVVPDRIAPEDSMLIVKDHVDKWVRNQLLLHMAEQNLTEEEKNVEQQIQDYRTSLLIFKYEQIFIKDKLDTAVSFKEIEEYYNNYSANFLLNTNILKGRYIKIPVNDSKLWTVRYWCFSDNEENIKKLEEYCYENNLQYEYFEEEWVYLDEILRGMPETNRSAENILQRDNYQARDGDYWHFLKISDKRLESNIAPLEFVKNDIRNIILNKRKLHLVQELESDVYNDALNRGNFTVY